jgi:outer membrane lipoprotein-sorting protein
MEVEKYTYKFLGNERLNERECFVVERYPRDTKNSGYSRIVSWTDKTEYRIWKEVYYDKKDRLLKTLTFSEYQLYIDSIWRAHSMTMVNHQNRKETDLHWSNFVFQTDLTDRDFTKSSLKRAR